MNGPNLNGSPHREGVSAFQESYSLKDLSVRFEVDEKVISELIREGKVNDVTELKDRYSATEADEIYCTVLDAAVPAAIRL